MLQDAIVVQQSYEKFITQVCESGSVWILENATEYATTSSNEFEDDEGEPLRVICFWSSRSLAKHCAKKDWASYAPSEIQLSEFIEDWCIGMANDNTLVGPNFDRNMFGSEADPLELILEITKELKRQNKEITLKNYTHLDVLEREVKLILHH